MLHINYPFKIPQDCDDEAVECVDARGRPLLVTTRPQRTGLAYSRVAALFRAPDRRTHVWRNASFAQMADARIARWTLAAEGAVHAGESGEDAVWRLLLGHAYWRDALALLSDRPRLIPLLDLPPEEAGELYPPQEFGRVRFVLYTGRLPTLPLTHPDHLWLDADELLGFSHEFQELISPLFQHVQRRLSA